MEPDAVQRENKPLECRLILLGALKFNACVAPLIRLQYLRKTRSANLGEGKVRCDLIGHSQVER